MVRRSLVLLLVSSMMARPLSAIVRQVKNCFVNANQVDRNRSFRVNRPNEFREHVLRPFVYDRQERQQIFDDRVAAMQCMWWASVGTLLGVRLAGAYFGGKEASAAVTRRVKIARYLGWGGFWGSCIHAIVTGYRKGRLDAMEQAAELRKRNFEGARAGGIFYAHEEQQAREAIERCYGVVEAQRAHDNPQGPAWNSDVIPQAEKDWFAATKKRHEDERRAREERDKQWHDQWWGGHQQRDQKGANQDRAGAGQAGANADPQGYYALLGVGRDATNADITKAFRREASKHHPDKNRNKSEQEQKEAEAKMKELVNARDTLLDPQKRADYDNPPRLGARAGGRGGGPEPDVDIEELLRQMRANFRRNWDN